jgi:hypothetical protein
MIPVDAAGWPPLRSLSVSEVPMSVGEATQTMTKRNDVSVKMDAEVVNDARIAASYSGMSLAEYLSETLRPIVERDIEEGHKRRKQGPKPKGAK